MTPVRLALSLLLLVPVAASAQTPDSAKRGIPLSAGDSALRLPADRIEDLLPWAPGGGVDADARPSWHGRPVSLLGRSIDGVAWGGLIRTSRFSSAVIPLVPSPDLDAIGSAEILTDAYSVTEGSDGPGLLRFTTRPGGDRWEVGGSAETGAPFRPEGGPGISRFAASAGGPVAAGWRFRTAATLLGRLSTPSGIGYGESPYFMPTGIDTSYTWEVAPGDSVSGFVQRFASGDRVPTTPRTTTDLYARLDGTVGGTAVWARYLRATEAQRDFNYLHASNPAQSFGRDGATHDLAVGATLPAIIGWRFGGHVSFQQEQVQSGPLDPSEEVDTRDPALGLLLGGAGLRYTLESFPVDEELLWNYRGNIPGSRRSPYDLENTAQYQLVDNYRNNAYGVIGFSEGGGPVGTLQLYRDRRVGVQVTGARSTGIGVVTFGAETRVHDIQSYRHGLTTQAFSDVWLAKPVEQALFADWTAHTATWSVSAGARLDRFDTKARRPKEFPRITSRWGYNSADREGWWEDLSVADRSHSAFSARVTAQGEVAPSVFLRGHAGRFARTPDLGLQLAGSNTDIAITSTEHPFGSDYGHELTDVIGVGIARVEAKRGIDFELFQIRYSKTPVVRLVSRFDAVRGTNNEFLEAQLLTGGAQSGATLGGHVEVSPLLTLRGTVTRHFKASDSWPFDSDFGPNPDAVRPTALAVIAELRAPATGPMSGLAAIVGARHSSGLARAVVPEFAPYDPFTIYSTVRRDDVSAWTSIDLRLTKTLPLAGKALVVYLDARNLLNAENLLRAFDRGNPTSSASSEAIRFSVDSSSWAREASNNGRYDNGNIDLTFGYAGCGGWVATSGQLAPPNCGYLINAEGRFGNGDGTFSLAEQQAASLAYYRTAYGSGAFNGPPREIRVGARMGF